jgi:Amiloride-sensitive sodium channel
MEENRQEAGKWAVLKIVVTEHFLGSTAHALPNIFRTSNVALKCIWIACLIASTAYCMKSVIVSFQDFLSYPSYVSTTIVQEIPTKFPAVTICNINTIHKTSAFGQSYVNSAWYLNQTYVNPRTIHDPYEYMRRKKYFSRTAVNNDKNLTHIDREGLGFTLNYMMISCMFNYGRCNTSDFRYIYDAQYGNCYTFNKGIDNNGTITNVKEVSLGKNDPVFLHIFIILSTNSWST